MKIKKLHKKLWKKSDDAIISGRLLSEIYSNVPKEIADVHVIVNEYHIFDCDKKIKKKVMQFINS